MKKVRKDILTDIIDDVVIDKDGNKVRTFHSDISLSLNLANKQLNSQILDLLDERLQATSQVDDGLKVSDVRNSKDISELVDILATRAVQFPSDYEMVNRSICDMVKKAKDNKVLADKAQKAADDYKALCAKYGLEVHE